MLLRLYLLHVFERDHANYVSYERLLPDLREMLRESGWLA